MKKNNLNITGTNFYYDIIYFNAMSSLFSKISSTYKNFNFIQGKTLNRLKFPVSKLPFNYMMTDASLFIQTKLPNKIYKCNITLKKKHLLHKYKLNIQN